MNGVLTGETGADFIGLFAAAPDKNVTNHYITFRFIHTLHLITLHYGTLQYANQLTNHNITIYFVQTSHYGTRRAPIITTASIVGFKSWPFFAAGYFEEKQRFTYNLHINYINVSFMIYLDTYLALLNKDFYPSLMFTNI